MKDCGWIDHQGMIHISYKDKLTESVSSTYFWNDSDLEETCQQFYLRIEGRYALTCICKENL